MSFSKQFRGTALLVLAAVAAFPAEKRAEEETAAVDPGVVEGHGRQIATGVKEITAVVEALPKDIPIEVNLWGHSDIEQKGIFGWNLHVADRPTPDPFPAEQAELP
jgi:hypothetical protein